MNFSSCSEKDFCMYNLMPTHITSRIIRNTWRIAYACSKKAQCSF